MMWCEILDNLQFNKFLWNEWSLIVWCEAARGAACCVIQDPVNNCNNFLPLPARPHIIRHLVFPWECVPIPGRHYMERAGPDVSKGYMTPTILHSRLLHYICILIPFLKSKVQREKNVQFRMMKSIDSENNKYPCIQMHICVHSMLYSDRAIDD